jgi:hypothetical protein
MCPACLAVAGLLAAVFRPWQRRRRAAQAEQAAAWQAEAEFRV